MDFLDDPRSGAPNEDVTDIRTIASVSASIRLARTTAIAALPMLILAATLLLSLGMVAVSAASGG